MKKNLPLIIFILLLSLSCFFNLISYGKNQESPGLEVILKKDLEKDLNEKQVQDGENKLTFRARKSALWFKNKIANKTKGNVVEVSLEGELYNPPKKISEVSKNKIDRSTPEGVLASFFSASEKADLDWITSNYIDEEKDKVKTFFEDKKNLQDSKSASKSIKSKFITGKAKYKDYSIVFIEQNYKNGKDVTEAIACKETSDGWKITNEIANDEVFDIVFAAVNSGEVISGKEKLSEKD